MRLLIAIAASLTAACAHSDPRHARASTQDAQALHLSRTADDSVQESQVSGQTSAPLVREHPPTGLATADKPPGRAAARPTELPESGGGLELAGRRPSPTAGAAPIQLEPTSTEPPRASLPPSKPASATAVNNPLEKQRERPRLGADIAAADAELRERIQRSLLRREDLSYTARHVGVRVQDRNVTLQGRVRTAHERAEVEALIRQLEGIRSVESELVVINAPPPGGTGDATDRR